MGEVKNFIKHNYCHFNAAKLYKHVPNYRNLSANDEKITWGKLETTTPRFIIESDATIVAPLIFAYALNQ